MDIKKTVANKVRQAMESKGESINNTAKLASIPYTTFHRKLDEDSAYDFTMSELGRLADALEIHPTELMPEEFLNVEAA